MLVPATTLLRSAIGDVPDEPHSALFPHGVGIGEAGDGRGPPSHDPV